MTYLASCGGSDCASVDAGTLNFSKIDESGLAADSTWASDTLITNNNSWTVTIPSDVAAGQYLIRRELLALHGADTEGGAQFYLMCANLQITGSGTTTPQGARFPGAYSAADPGILVNIYGALTRYTIPGPAVYAAGGASAVATPVAAVATAVIGTSAVVPTVVIGVVTNVVTNVVTSKANPIGPCDTHPHPCFCCGRVWHLCEYLCNLQRVSQRCKRVYAQRVERDRIGGFFGV